MWSNNCLVFKKLVNPNKPFVTKFMPHVGTATTPPKWQLPRLGSFHQPVSVRLAFVEPTRQSWWRRSIPLRVGVEQLAPQHPIIDEMHPSEVSGDSSRKLWIRVVLARFRKLLGLNRIQTSFAAVDWSYQVLLSYSWLISQVWIYHRSLPLHMPHRWRQEKTKCRQGHPHIPCGRICSKEIFLEKICWKKKFQKQHLLADSTPNI